MQQNNGFRNQNNTINANRQNNPNNPNARYSQNQKLFVFQNPWIQPDYSAVRERNAALAAAARDQSAVLATQRNQAYRTKSKDSLKDCVRVMNPEMKQALQEVRQRLNSSKLSFNRSLSQFRPKFKTNNLSTGFRKRNSVNKRSTRSASVNRSRFSRPPISRSGATRSQTSFSSNASSVQARRAKNKNNVSRTKSGRNISPFRSNNRRNQRSRSSRRSSRRNSRRNRSLQIRFNPNSITRRNRRKLKRVRRNRDRKTRLSAILKKILSKNISSATKQNQSKTVSTLSARQCSVSNSNSTQLTKCIRNRGPMSPYNPVNSAFCSEQISSSANSCPSSNTSTANRSRFSDVRPNLKNDFFSSKQTNQSDYYNSNQNYGTSFQQNQSLQSNRSFTQVKQPLPSNRFNNQNSTNSTHFPPN